MTGGAPWTAIVPVPARVTEIRARLAPVSSAPSGAQLADDAGRFASALAGAQSLTGRHGGTAMTPAAYTSVPVAPGIDSYRGSGFGSSVPATGSTAADVVPIALRYVGVPYVWGGNDPATGLDCSGFTKLVFGSLGVTLPRVSTDQATMGTRVASLADARPGDLLAFGSPVDHVAIYLGDGRMVHAAGTGKGVRVDDVYRTPTAIRRLLQATGAAGSSSVPADPSAYADSLADAGARYDVDPALLSAIARAESGYNPNAVSRAGALGLMQLMPATAAGLGVDPLDPAQAIDGAARYLSQQLATFGSVELALAAYNAGPGAVSRHGGIPPYPETQAYVAKVLSFRDQLTAAFRDQNTIGVPA